MKEKVIISACLSGQNCRFDGKSKMLPEYHELKKRYILLPICPEVKGDLPVPRPRAWIDCGTGKDILEGKTRVVNELSRDVTDNYISGARKTLQLAMANNVSKAFLKSKSPSCGFGQVYNEKTLVEGNGVTAELLIRHGIEVIAI